VVSEIKMLPEREEFLTVGWDGAISVWDLSSGLIKSKNRMERSLHTVVYDDTRNLILAAGDGRQIFLLNSSDLSLIDKLSGHQSAIVSLQLNESAGLLVSNSLDGITKIWDLDKRKEFFEHLHIGKKDWMVKTNSGYFNATEGARSVIHFVKGNETYAADQFFNSFYRPDLIPDLFSVRGGSSKRESLLDKLDKFPPPEVKLAIQPNEENTRVLLYLKSLEKGGGYGTLKLFHNGKRVETDIIEKNTTKSGQNERLTKIELPLIGGKNVFGVVAVSKAGMESPLVEKEVFSNQKIPSATCYLLAIGINDYQNNNLDLNYARSDAEAFAKALMQDEKQLFNETKVRSLYDEMATRDNILSALDEIANQATINDVFIFYYAGHGSVTNGKFFFIPTETSRLFDINNLEKTALSALVLQEKFKKVKALKQVIIMDACQSGKSAELLAQRGSVEEKAIAQLSRSAGIHVLASAGSEQFASEFKELEHGLFTYVLLEAMKGAADGSPREGKVTLFELKSYLDDQVPEMSMRYKGKPQYPYTFSRGNDFPLKVITQE
ncbi:MAG: caspase family protein, partial [Cyclobacteriaceae bacterium]